jgi:hypothetical protein
MFIHEDEGNTGKSFFASYLFAKYNAFLCDTVKKEDVMLQYNSQPIVVFDLTRRAAADMDQHFLENVKDGRAQSRKYHSQMKLFDPPKVLVLMNPPPNTSILSHDR